MPKPPKIRKQKRQGGAAGADVVKLVSRSNGSPAIADSDARFQEPAVKVRQNCSFCGRGLGDVCSLYHSPKKDAAICDGCVADCLMSVLKMAREDRQIVAKIRSQLPVS